jgi:hypothetical protein
MYSFKFNVFQNISKYMVEYKISVMQTYGNRKRIAFKIEDQVTNRIVIKTFLTSSVQGSLEQKTTWAPLCSTQPMMTWNVKCGMWGDI